MKKFLKKEDMKKVLMKLKEIGNARNEASGGMRVEILEILVEDKDYFFCLEEIVGGYLHLMKSIEEHYPEFNIRKNIRLVDGNKLLLNIPNVGAVFFKYDLLMGFKFEE